MPTPASKPATGSCWPTPRMKAVRVELVPRDTSSVTFGATFATSVMSATPSWARRSPSKAETERGTSMRFSSRRWAVTTTAPKRRSACGVASSSTCANAGARGVNALAARAINATRDVCLLMPFLLGVECNMLRLSNSTFVEKRLKSDSLSIALTLGACFPGRRDLIATPNPHRHADRLERLVDRLHFSPYEPCAWLITMTF